MGEFRERAGKPSCRAEAPAFNPLTPCLDSTNSQRGICDSVFPTREVHARGGRCRMFVAGGRGTRKSRQDAFGFKAHENCRKPWVENATSFHRMRLPSRGASPAADGPSAENGAIACSPSDVLRAVTRLPSSLSQCVYLLSRSDDSSSVLTVRGEG